MPGGFGNTGLATHGSFAFATVTAGLQQITGPGWTAAVGDITAINAMDGELRTKVVSKHLDPQPFTLTYFMDPANHVQPDATSQGNIVISYPNSPLKTFTDSAAMTSFKMGDLIEDDVMVGECEFMLLGGGVLPALA